MPRKGKGIMNGTVAFYRGVMQESADRLHHCNTRTDWLESWHITPLGRTVALTETSTCYPCLAYSSQGFSAPSSPSFKQTRRTSVRLSSCTNVRTLPYAYITRPRFIQEARSTRNASWSWSCDSWFQRRSHTSLARRTNHADPDGKTNARLCRIYRCPHYCWDRRR